MRKRTKRYILLAGLVIAIALVIGYGITYAKYVSNSIWNYYLKSQGFYFSSEQLNIGTTKNVNNLWNGGSVNFSINNSLNPTVISDYDINYNVTCTINGEAANHTTCNLFDTGTNQYEGVLLSKKICINNTNDGVDTSKMDKNECETNQYDYISQVSVNDLHFDIVLTDENYEIKDLTINIEVNTTAPYHKTLSGNFLLHKINSKEEKVNLFYKDNSEYGELVISNSYKTAKCIKIAWDSSKFKIDTKSNQFNSYIEDEDGYIKEITLSINPKKSISYMFYKINFEEVYDVTEFTYSDTTGC